MFRRFRSTQIAISIGSSAALLLLAGHTGQAAISGVCSNCHTMHNSQSGAAVASGTAYGDPAYGALLKETCAGCHTKTGGNDANDDAIDDNTAAPLVIVPAAPGGNVYDWLPGGYFYADAADQTTFHNVDTVKSGAAVTPYGWDKTVDANRTGIGDTWATQLTCAGTYGCHGDSSATDPNGAVSGKHHDANSRGYRMLNDIAGTASASFTVTGNGYSAGADGTYSGGGGGGGGKTISYLCSECHGAFHTAANTSSGGAWVRHPTDRNLNKTTPDNYASYGDSGGGNAIDAEVPIGTDDLATYATLNDLDGKDQPTHKFVICLSCHYAHGSNEARILRFDYTAMTVGAAGLSAKTGCFRCHTAKDGV